MRKSTGITRKLDPLGRVVLPKELRRTLYLNENDPMEIFTEGNQIILQKYEPGCIFCDNASGLEEFKGKYICVECKSDLKGMKI